MDKYILAGAFLLLTLLSACSKHVITFNPDPIRPGMLEPLRGSKPVSLINACQDVEPVYLWKPVYYDKCSSTASLIALISKELTASGFRVVESSKTTLSFSMEDMQQGPQGQFLTPCTVTYHVQLGGGQPLVFSDIDKSRNWIHSCQFATTKTVANILNNSEVRAYLQGESLTRSNLAEDVDIKVRLRKLDELLKEGLLTQSEYRQKKQKILEDL